MFDVSKNFFIIDNENSFKNITNQWYELCKTKAEEATLILVANKTDLNM